MDIYDLVESQRFQANMYSQKCENFEILPKFLLHENTIIKKHIYCVSLKLQQVFRVNWTYKIFLSYFVPMMCVVI
jgi:hypothetical protein